MPATVRVFPGELNRAQGPVIQQHEAIPACFRPFLHLAQGDGPLYVHSPLFHIDHIPAHCQGLRQAEAGEEHKLEQRGIDKARPMLVFVELVDDGVGFGQGERVDLLIPALIRESKDGIGRVARIVKDLKDFSRVETSHDWQVADLHQGIESTLNIVASELRHKADLVKDYSPLPPVECLPSQINQVIMNLLVNATQAMGAERGRITLRTGASDKWVWIEVADNGCGIPGESLQKIFDPFYTTKPIGQGTGLGLSLSYGIIKRHGGEIRVDSEVGVGTTFRVELPIHQARSA